MDGINDSINLEQIIRIVLRKWFVVAISLIVFTLAAAIYFLYLVEDTYEAFTTIFIYNESLVMNNQIEYSQVMTNEKLVKDYSVIAKSNRVLDKVRENLPTTIVNPKSITVEAVPDTRVLKLTVRDGNPYTAANIANETTRVLIEEAKDITNITNISVIDDAVVPLEPKSVPVISYTLISAILGIVAGVGIILFLEMFDKTVKDLGELSEKFDIPVLALIPRFELTDIEVSNEESA